MMGLYMRYFGATLPTRPQLSYKNIVENVGTHKKGIF